MKWRSLRSYYLEESYGKLKISGKVAPWYLSSHSYKDYPQHSTTINTLVEEAVSYYFNNNPGDSRSNYDSDGDGKIDGLFVFYGSNYHSEGITANNAHSMSWERNNPTGISDSYISSYVWMSALDIYGLGGFYYTGSQLNAEDLSKFSLYPYTKTIIHEFGHVLGLKDLYDTQSLTNFPEGLSTMQSHDVGGHDPFSNMALGFANPYVFDSGDSSLDDEINITIRDFQSSGDLILLTPHFNTSNEVFDEYIVLEYFTPTGLNEYDFGKSGSNLSPGIRVWHVNAELLNQKHRYSNNASQSDYDLVHLIRNNINEAFHSSSFFSSDSLFKVGDKFDMETYKSQFFNADGKLDNGSSLNWSFEIINSLDDELGNSQITIKLSK